MAVEAGLGTAKGVNTIIVPVPQRVARFGMAPRPRYWLKAGSRRLGPQPLAGIGRGSRSSREGDRFFDRLTACVCPREACSPHLAH